MSEDNDGLRPTFCDPDLWRELIDFINLNGCHEILDVTASVYFNPVTLEHDAWHGRGSQERGHEILYRTMEGRWVLNVSNVPEYEDEESPNRPHRELTPAQAARWFCLNWIDTPVGLRPASLIDLDDRRNGQARLDPDWTPLGRSSDCSPARGGAAQDQSISTAPKQSPLDSMTPGFEEAPSGSPQESSRTSSVLPICDLKPSAPIPPVGRLNPSVPEAEVAASELSRPPSPEAPPLSLCPVSLGGPRDSPIVYGKEKALLSEAKYDVIKALLTANRPLSKDELDKRSGRSDARKHLRDLARKDPDWEAVIIFPAAYGAGYDIRR